MDIPADVRRIVEDERLGAPAGAESIERSVAIALGYLACAVVALHWQRIAIWLPTWIAMAVIMNGALSAAHEGVHGNLLRSPTANRLLAQAWSLSVLLNFSLYRAYHLEHHRRTRLEGDPEPQADFSGLAGYLVVFPIGGLYAALQLWMRSLASLVGSFPTYVRTDRQRRAIRTDAIVVLLATGALAAWALTDVRTFLIVWAMPMLVSSAVFTVTALPEHYGCPRVADPLRVTRSTRSNRLFSFLYWNNNFHAEHHLIPSVPYVRLPRLSAVLGERVLNQSPSYTRWHLNLIRELVHPTVIDLRVPPNSEAVPRVVEQAVRHPE